MDITNRIIELDSTLQLHNEGKWNEPLNKDLDGFTSFNDAGLETETGELLYGFIRAMKPKNVLETGSHVGVGASYMGVALKENKNGHLDTIEFLPENHIQCEKRMEKLGLKDYVTCHYGDVANFEPSVTYDFILLDTEPQTRFAELEKFYPYLNEGGFVFIHDLHRHMHQIPNEEHGFAWPYGKVTKFMTEMVKTDKLRPFHFPTPRGLTGFYKVNSADYKFNEK